MQDYVNRIIERIDQLKDYATNGDIPIHQALAEINTQDLEAYLKEAIKEIKDQAIEELRDRYMEANEKTYQDQYYKYNVRGGSTRYSFTKVKAVKEAKNVAEKTTEWLLYKEVEAKYKQAFIMRQKNQSIIDEHTGEIVDPSEVTVSYGPDSLIIKPIR